MRIVQQWPEIDRTREPIESVYPAEWWDGKIRELVAGDLPWWPHSRELESVRASLRIAAKRAGYIIRTTKVDEKTVAFQRTDVLR